MQMPLESRIKGTIPGKACTTKIEQSKANVSKSVSVMKFGKLHLCIKMLQLIEFLTKFSETFKDPSRYWYYSELGARRNASKWFVRASKEPFKILFKKHRKRVLQTFRNITAKNTNIEGHLGGPVSWASGLISAQLLMSGFWVQAPMWSLLKKNFFSTKKKNMNIDEANSISHYIARIVHLEKWG